LAKTNFANPPPLDLDGAVNITYNFAASIDDNNSFYIAGLRRNFRMDQTHKLEFDPDQTEQNITYIVEQNSGNITAPSSIITLSGITYSFAG